MQTNYNSYNPYFGLNLGDNFRTKLQNSYKPNEVKKIEKKIDKMGHDDYTVDYKWIQNGKGVCKIVASNGKDTVILAQNGTLNGAMQKFLKLTKEQVDSAFTA